MTSSELDCSISKVGLWTMGQWGFQRSQNSSVNLRMLAGQKKFASIFEDTVGADSNSTGEAFADFVRRGVRFSQISADLKYRGSPKFRSYSNDNPRRLAG